MTSVPLSRLVGPDQPEIDCDACFADLDGYVEAELDSADADEQFPGMRAHLAACSACGEEYESLRTLIAT